MKFRLAVFASGEGTNFSAIVEATRDGRLHAEVAGLIVDRDATGAERRARAAGIPCAVIKPSAHATKEQWDQAILAQLRQWQVGAVALAGFLRRIGPGVLAAYPGRIVNSHPSLLPQFGGKGMYGDHVHAAVLKSAAGQNSRTGITVHLVDRDYDSGAIVASLAVDVLADDSVERLARRVKAAENEFYPKVLNDLVSRWSTAN